MRLISLIVIIISQLINKSKHQIVDFKVIKFHLSILPQENQELQQQNIFKKTETTYPQMSPH